MQREHYSLLKLLAQSKKAKYIVHELDDDIIDCLSECSLNILEGNIPLSVSQKNKLKKHKNNLRKFRLKKTSKKKKKAILQKGGFLPALLAPVLASIAGPVLSRLFAS